MSEAHAHTLRLLSAFCGLLGALGLSFELLWGFPRRNKLHQVEVKIAQLTEFLVEQEQTIRRLPPLYSEGEKGVLIRDLREQFVPGLLRLKEQANKLTEGHAEQSFYLGLAGCALLVAGFFLEVLIEL